MIIPAKPILPIDNIKPHAFPPFCRGWEEIKQLDNKQQDHQTIKKPSKRLEFKRYKKQVWVLTEKVAHRIPGIEKRAFKGHHIDHIISTFEGFKKGFPPERIAALKNLRMLDYRDNMRKGTSKTLLL